VITPDPASFTDAYALIKILSLKFKVNHFSIICNQVGSQEEGLSLYKRFHDVVNKFLLVGLEYLGAIPQDENLRKATQMQRLILRQDASSLSALAIRRMADQIDSSSRHIDSGGGMQLFWDQVVGCA
jgi:flagellar biosynthesis protein FlhG